MIGSVEHFGAEFQSPFFGDPEVLDDRNIFVPQPGSPQGVAAAVAERAGDWIGEGRGIEPAVLIVVRQNRIYASRAVQASGVRNEIGPARIPRGRIHGAAALQSRNRTELPAADHLIYKSSAIQKSLPLAEWQDIKHGSDKAVRNVEIRRTVFALRRAEGILGREV